MEKDKPLEFVMKSDFRQIVERRKAHVEKLFTVKIDVQSEHTEEGDGSSSSWLWLAISGHRTECQYAQTYLRALTEPQKNVTLEYDPFSNDFIQSDDFINAVERTSRAVIKCANHQITVEGCDETAIVLATSFIEDKISELTNSKRGGNELQLDNELRRLSSQNANLSLTMDSTHPEIKRAMLSTLSNESQEVNDKDIVDLTDSMEEDINLGFVVVHKGKVTSSAAANLQNYGEQQRVELQGATGSSSVKTNASSLSLASSHGHDSMRNSGRQKEQSSTSEDTKRASATVSSNVAVISPQINSPANKSLRYIIIDGSNVAMHHGSNKVFSCRGIELSVRYFLERGHKDVVALVPQWRQCRPTPQFPMEGQEILRKLHDEGHLDFTPSKKVGQKRIVCYDDRMMMQLAAQTDGVIVSNDFFRDLYEESNEWKSIISTRVLSYMFVQDIFMVPDDPFGIDGPRLDEVLTKTISPSKHKMPPPDTGTARNPWYHNQRGDQLPNQRFATSQSRPQALMPNQMRSTMASSSTTAPHGGQRYQTGTYGGVAVGATGPRPQQGGYRPSVPAAEQHSVGFYNLHQAGQQPAFASRSSAASASSSFSAATLPKQFETGDAVDSISRGFRGADTAMMRSKGAGQTVMMPYTTAVAGAGGGRAKRTFSDVQVSPARPRETGDEEQVDDEDTPVDAIIKDSAIAGTGPRSVEETEKLFRMLSDIFPNNERVIHKVLFKNPQERNTNKLSYLILEAQETA